MDIRKHRAKINALFSVVLLSAIIIFAREQAALSKINDWWIDELDALVVTDPTLHFADAFKNRISLDPTPPLYYTALYWARQAMRFPAGEERAEIVLLNLLAIILTSVAIIGASRRFQLTGFALMGIAVFLLSGAVLAYAPEGRAYMFAMCITFAAAWLVALIVTDSRYTFHPACFVIIGCLAALTHLFAALVCDCLAAGLMLLVVFGKRRDLLLPALALGAAASLTWGIWFISTDNAKMQSVAWIKFTPEVVRATLWQVRYFEIGEHGAAVLLFILLLLALVNTDTRSLAAAFCTAIALFFIIPVLASFKVPIICTRYWLIGAPLLTVLMIFLLRIGFVKTIESGSLGKPLAIGIGAAGLIISSSLTAFPAAYNQVENKLTWKGVALVQPLVKDCPAASIHVYRYVPKFMQITHSPEPVFADVRNQKLPLINGNENSCPVLGWAEHVYELMASSPTDETLLKFLKINAPVTEVEIYRYRSGYVVLRRKS